MPGIFTFDVPIKADAEGEYIFKICGKVDGGVVACEDDHIVVRGTGVPEPGIVFLMGLGLVGMGLARRAKA
ncbi:MAG: PEP-CTERM sorting domain-containing protein [Pseudomonadota bacterium]